MPSIGFGLLYLYFGLLPGIVLHFTFDVVWFALPVFIAVAPGIRFQQFMIVALTLVPLWVVLWRRYLSRRLDDAGTARPECGVGPAAGAARTCNGRRSAENRRTEPRVCAAPGSAQEEWRCSSCWR